MKLPRTSEDCGAVVTHYGRCECQSPRAIEILCKEVGYRFDKRMETPAMLVAFVRVLVQHVSQMREMEGRLTKFTGKTPSPDSADALSRVQEMLDGPLELMIPTCASLHDLCHKLNPEDAYPTDHLIDMLSSCVSAIRFGLGIPCHSRHAASAAQHIWKHLYGVHLFDSFTPAWEKDWICAQLQDAILSQLPPTERLSE